MATERNRTRTVTIGSVSIGFGHPIVVQSMCATKTSDVKATVASIKELVQAGAGIVRLAVDNKVDSDALKKIRAKTDANLSVDLQENYRLAAEVAPSVNKIRYNPGHLYHFEPERPWQDKVRFLVDTAVQHDCALRVGVNSGSVDPACREKFAPGDSQGPMLASALAHCEFLDQLGFTRYCVSLKESSPTAVVELNRRFAKERPDVPLHLGVTEAGMPPEGIEKTRWAFEKLLAAGIGDTLRVSLTVPATEKWREIMAGCEIICDVEEGRLQFADSAEEYHSATGQKLEIISCPSCSRVENDRFCDLARQVRAATLFAKDFPVSIAVMGCRVNGPGETDRADLGLWCGASSVNLKKGETLLGSFSYDEIIPRVIEELNAIVACMRK